MTFFHLPWPNPDLNIHPNPPEGWHRVAVLGGWEDAKKTRARWPHAAVVGPLRTVRGIDLLIRGLLSNPQIRVLVWDGRDLTPGETTKTALHRLFDLGDRGDVLPSLGHECGSVLGGVALVKRFYTSRSPWDVADGSWAADVPSNEDRPGGVILLPPPAPKPTTRAPHGDPGDRIAGNTLADVWPRVLRRVLECGREVPTQYGTTREVLDLVSVIRDPIATLEDFLADRATHLVLRCSRADVEAYYARLVERDVPEGAPYSYGSRLRGAGAFGLAADGERYRVDQIAALARLLDATPGTRAAFLTPWRPEEDSGKESGRPCLVGVWFRCVDGGLHLTICFRSHDLYGAYPLNLAAACLWLGETAKAHDKQVGTLTCLSMSVHIYERDFAAAQEVVAAYRPPPGLRWDLRTSWHVERIADGLRATALSPDGSQVARVFEAATQERLLRDLAESGLVQEPSAWLWLGGEVARVARRECI